MTVRYVGAIKEYLCLPLFALFGASGQAVRLISMLLGLLGIWGASALIREHSSPTAAALTSCVLAMNPAYVDLTTFDNGTVSIWMGAFGVLCFAASRYLRQKDAKSAFWLGVAMGLGVWARANFLWLVAAIFAAVLIVAGRRILLLSHWAAAALGGVAGGAPFLLYQVISRGGTWEAIGMFASRQPLGPLLSARLIMFAETLLSDREHRAIWGGPPLPQWQRCVFPVIAIAACGFCLRRNSPLLARAAAVVFLLVGAFLFLSRMPVAEHHMIVLLPMAAAVTIFAGITIAKYRWGRPLVMAVATAYFGSAIFWQVVAIRGLWSTGGIGQWSDAIFALSDYLQKNYPDREIKILDWGLQNNLYVLSDGRIRSRELYGSDSDSQISRWIEEIRRGGVFLMNGPGNRQFTAASNAFLEALAVARPTGKRFTVTQAGGDPYAEIIEIALEGPAP